MFGDKDKEKDKARGDDKVAARSKEPAVPGKGATLIAGNTRIQGDVHFADQLLVNGEIQGNVFAEADSDAGLTVSAKGSVIGEIRVPNVVINGLVKGDVHATKHVELAAEARVEGNVYYHLIEMVMGARVDGSLVYCPGGESKPAGRVSVAPVSEAKPTMAVGKAQG
ncbi:MAG: polymer-forming cytoskeletal protein [Pseudomonadales bacterium]|jgi:cytoskeletal protein CcmA (bactofilin family)|nr:polymer-forming cytoskeletal protein [Pseudomonadales bacterium]